ncbi:MAG TPA: DUF1761 domain-containing protein, partial [Methylococcus sp.]|nr:DUF1761 domain-containing protein [Methylococcus sp.]
MSIDLGSVNWLAVIIGTVVYFALGALWFAPMTPIGRAWVKASAYESPTSGTRSTNLFYVFPLVSCFVMVTALALLAAATGVESIGEGIVLGLVVGIGFALPLFITTAAFEFKKPQPFTWGVIDASYHVIGLVIA